MAKQLIPTKFCYFLNTTGKSKVSNTWSNHEVNANNKLNLTEKQILFKTVVTFIA